MLTPDKMNTTSKMVSKMEDNIFTDDICPGRASDLYRNILFVAIVLIGGLYNSVFNFG